MKRGELIQRFRMQMPPATIESISDAQIATELNVGCNEVNRLAKVYKGSTGYIDIMTVPEQFVYAFSDFAPQYLDIDKPGIWWYSSDNQSKYLFRKTETYLDEWIRNWRDQPSGEPNWYAIDGDLLWLFPKASTQNKVRIYCLQKATPMDNNDNYPWKNTTTEVAALQPMDDAIVAYARYKLSPAVGKEGESNPLYVEFLREVKKGKAQIKRRPDAMSSYDTFLRIDGMSV